MVPVAGSVEIRSWWAGALGASARQPAVAVASQRLTLTTARTLAPPTFTTYAEPVCGTSANALGNGLYPGSWFGEACSFGALCWQPDVAVPLHVLVLIAESVLSPWFTAKTVPEDGSTATNWGFAPVVTVGGVLPQPVVTLALQRAPLMTETVPSLLLAT